MTPEEEKRKLDERLAKLEVPEGLYRADMELHDRSLRFSSELLKLALGGIAASGFFLASIPEKYQAIAFNDPVFKILLISAVVGSAGSVASTLWHRFLSGGASFHHLEFIKMMQIKTPDDFIQKKAEDFRKLRGVKFRWLHRCLIFAAVLLSASVFLLCAAFIVLMNGK